MLKIKVIKAFDGDCILISFLDSDEKVKNILVDGGTHRTYSRNLKPILQCVQDKEESIDLLVITHIHDDHIGGIVEFYQDIDFNKDLIKKYGLILKVY